MIVLSNRSMKAFKAFVKVRILLQKQPLEVFCEKRSLLTFRKIHKKTPVPQAWNFISKEALA